MTAAALEQRDVRETRNLVPGIHSHSPEQTIPARLETALSRDEPYWGDRLAFGIWIVSFLIMAIINLLDMAASPWRG